MSDIGSTVLKRKNKKVEKMRTRDSPLHFMFDVPAHSCIIAPADIYNEPQFNTDIRFFGSLMVGVRFSSCPRPYFSVSS
jgi:hypothetical protein